MKKKFTIIGLFFLIVLIILSVPSIVSILMEWSWMDIGTQKAESWMSFWGGYLGAIIGIIGAITATTLQIRSQTNQIVMAARENDKFERKRINLSLKIEKNVELFKSFIELKSNIIKYVYIKKSIFTIEKEIFFNYSQKFTKENELKDEYKKLENLKGYNNTFGTSEIEKSNNIVKINEREIDELNQAINVSNENVGILKNDLNQIITSLRVLSTSISSNKVFVDDQSDYLRKLECYLSKIQKEIIDTENFLDKKELPFSHPSFKKEIIKEMEEKIKEIHLIEVEIDKIYAKYIKTLVSKIEAN